MEPDLVIKLLLDYEICYQHIKNPKLYLIPMLINCKDTERHLLSEFYSRKGHRINRYFFVNSGQPVMMFLRVFSTIYSNYYTGIVWNNEGDKIEMSYGWTSNEQVVLFYKLNHYSSVVIRFETNIMMVEYVSTHSHNSNDEIFFCKICHFFRSVCRNLYWKLEIDEIIECSCKGHPFDLSEIFQALLTGKFLFTYIICHIL
jgi:hypothetical protein